VLVCFILGATVVPLVTLLVSGLLGKLFDVDSGPFSALIVPLVEETLKIVPLLVLLILPRWRYRWTAGATDLLVMAAALGAGFGFYEETLRSVAHGFPADALIARHANTPHLGPLYLFPNLSTQYYAYGRVLRGGPGTLPAFVGHSGATAFIGLGVGLARLLEAQLTRRLGARRRVVWVIPLVVWGWMVFDHALFNYSADPTQLSGVLKVIYALDGYGRASTYLLYLLLLAAIGIERWILHRVRWRTVDLQLPIDRLSPLKAKPTSLVDRLWALLFLRGFLLERRGLSYGLYDYHQTGRGDAAQRAYLDRLAGALLLWRHDLLLPLTPPVAIEQGAGQAAPNQSTVEGGTGTVDTY
jgi:RsiW-degrading membrane proteinase PrsW (M82 family)